MLLALDAASIALTALTSAGVARAVTVTGSRRAMAGQLTLGASRNGAQTC